MLEIALEEARSGLAEGGIPIGAALFAADGKLLGRAGIGASRSRIPHCMVRPTRFGAVAGGAATGTR